MVSAYRVDTLRDPTAALQDFYDESKGATCENFPQLVSEHYARVFQSLEAFHEIPTLDVRNPPDTFRDRSLVRFRAMVQDTSPSSEMYLSKSRSGKCGGWGIELDEEEDSRVDLFDLRECSVLWAVSIPAESTWCADELDGPASHQEKSDSSRQTLPFQPQHVHKYPHTAVPHIGVQVKIYDSDFSEKLKSTDVATFVGILTNESLSSSLDMIVDVPTLHILYTQQHPSTLIPRPYPRITAPGSDQSGGLFDTAKVRAELISWMAEEALCGDREAAEWVLLASLARVQSRNPPLLPPSLTLTHFPAPPPVPSTSRAVSSPLPTLSPVLEQLLPLTHTLPLSLDLLNKDPFTPESKDEDLHSGALQLPHGTVLLVNEGGIKEGKLVERGIFNIKALQEVMSMQTLAYAFPFSQFSFPTDISCIILSEGSKSTFFRTDILVPVNVAQDPVSTAKMYQPAGNVSLPPNDQLATFRDLIVGARSGKVQVSEETSEYIQHDFVQERQKDKSITSEDLIRRMTIAKLYALSFHESSLTVEIWERAKALDERRRTVCSQSRAAGSSQP